ncbi:hypothetical protein KY366_01230 [Candidatus Woesearchaeota archaeon]|nr:hypothetical protein [Candidatus Woesearchaeota archaeon]
MKGKKGIMLEFLVRTIIAIIFLSGAVALGKSFFRVSSQAEQNFDRFVKTIEEAEEGTRSMELIMDQKTMILYFDKGSDYIGFIELESAINKFFGHGDSIEYVKKPDRCPKEGACTCLCLNKLEEDKEMRDEIIFPTDKEYDSIRHYSCSKIKKCVSVSKDKILKQGITSPSIGLVNIVDHVFKGGFFIERMALSTGPKKERRDTIYIQNYKGNIGICENVPCITEEMIKQRLPLTDEEFVNAKFIFEKGWMIGIDNDGDSVLEDFYHIKDIKKDLFDNYYYEYEQGIGPESALKPADFLDTLTETSQEQTGFPGMVEEGLKQDFESMLINYAKEGKAVEIDYDIKRSDIRDFEPETKMDKEGNVINVGVSRSW